MIREIFEANRLTLSVKPQVQKVQEFIQQHRLLKEDQPVLVAVSGGKDSVTLTHILHTLGYPIQLAHVNFSLRGNESDEDALFVKDLASFLNIPCHSTTFDTAAEAKSGESIQMTARRLRYRWFEELASAQGIDAIATAHSANDNAETILYNLTKGTGLAGIVGIPRKNGRVIRPLLPLTTSEILDYLNEEELAFRQDSSNASDKYARNKIRQQVIPGLKAINSSLISTFSDHSDRFSAIHRLYQVGLEHWKAKCWSENDLGYWVFEIDQLDQLPEVETLFIEWLRPLGFHPDQIQSFQKQGLSGASITSESHELLRTQHGLWLGELEQKTDFSACIDLKKAGSLETKMGTLSWELLDQVPEEKLKQPEYGLFNAERFPTQLKLCSNDEGDRFQPYGMKVGSQLISDFFINNKVSLPEKRRALLLKDGQNVVWIAGMRISHPYRVIDPDRPCWIFKWSKKTKSAFPFVQNI